MAEGTFPQWAVLAAVRLHWPGQEDTEMSCELVAALAALNLCLPALLPPRPPSSAEYPWKRSALIQQMGAALHS